VELRIEKAGKQRRTAGLAATLTQPKIPRTADGIPQDIAEHMRLGCATSWVGIQTDLDPHLQAEAEQIDSFVRSVPKLGVEYMNPYLLSHSERRTG
jgi:hypothetical protein